MPDRSTFRPDWVSAPGQTIADLLEERHLSANDLATTIGLSRGDTTALIEGRLLLTDAIASRLEAAFGVPTRFWIARESTFRSELTRLQKKVSPATPSEWIRELPVRDMIKFGWLRQENREDLVSSCLQFFGTPDLDQWRVAYQDVLKGAAFRESPSYRSNPAAVAAWIRQGERVASSIECAPWDGSRFEAILPELRSLTRKKQPRLFMTQLVRRCADCGVAVAVVPAPTGCRVSGATRFVTRHRALLLLSFRYRTDDQFWFTFFHEAAHLVLHGERSSFLEGPVSQSTKEEAEANQYAANVLVPTEALGSLRTPGTSHEEVLRFARWLGVSPGIVVGQLQHLGMLPVHHLNRLKRRYAWEEEIASS
jgi:plasmid maintenance system antidote protein VapI